MKIQIYTPYKKFLNFAVNGLTTVLAFYIILTFLFLSEFEMNIWFYILITLISSTIIFSLVNILYKPNSNINLNNNYSLFINSYEPIKKITSKEDIAYARNFLFEKKSKKIVELNNKQCYQLLNSSEIKITYKEVQQKTILYAEQDPKIILSMFFNFMG